MPSPWVTRAIKGELPLSERYSGRSFMPTSPELRDQLFVAESAQHLTGGRIGADFVCWEALVTRDCPFGHSWQLVSEAAPHVMLPLATYGGREHLALSDAAWVTYMEGKDE